MMKLSLATLSSFQCILNYKLLFLLASIIDFVDIAHYSRRFGKASHIFLKNGLWRMLASLANTCQASWWMLAQERFYAQITYFICIKCSSLHSLNSPNLPDSPNSRYTCKTWLLGVWQVRAKQVGKCRRVWRVLAKPQQMLANDKIGHFRYK